MLKPNFLMSITVILNKGFNGIENWRGLWIIIYNIDAVFFSTFVAFEESTIYFFAKIFFPTYNPPMSNIIPTPTLAFSTNLSSVVFKIISRVSSDHLVTRQKLGRFFILNKNIMMLRTKLIDNKIASTWFKIRKKNRYFIL